MTRLSDFRITPKKRAIGVFLPVLYFICCDIDRIGIIFLSNQQPDRFINGFSLCFLQVVWPCGLALEITVLFRATLDNAMIMGYGLWVYE
jgi:hypothetical protein